MAIQEQSVYYKQIQAEREAFWRQRRARRIDPDRVPRAVLQKLRPTWRHWETIPFEEARALQASDTVKLFLLGREGWEAVPNFRRREIGQKTLAFRRLPDSWRPMAATRTPRRREPLPVMSSAYVDDPEPVATITSPANGARLTLGERAHFRSRILEHRVREGETAAGVAQRHTGEADPNRILGYAGGGIAPTTGPLRPGAAVKVRGAPELEVHGSGWNTDTVQLRWEGPTRGQATLPVTHDAWETTLPARPGRYTLTATAGGQPHRIEVDVVGVVKIVDIAYAPATGTFYLLTEGDLQELEAAGRPLDEAVQALLKAREAGDEGAVARATADIQRRLRDANNAPLVEGAGSDAITEVIRFAGRKATLVPKGKVRRHWRTYRLDAGMKDRSRRKDLLGADGCFSTRKLLDRMKQSIEQESGFRAEFVKADVVADALNDWARAFNSRPDVVLFENRDAEGNAILDATVAAQLLRYSAGYTLSGAFNPAAGRFGLKGQARAELALAEGRLMVNGHFPDERGLALKVSLPLDDGGRTEADLGAMRAKLELALYGYAGASAALSADLEFRVERGMVRLKGADDPERLKKEDRRFEPVASAGASAFAGVRAGCEAKGALEWDNPLDRNVGGEPNWRALAAVGADGHVDAGAGAETEFQINYANGKFYIRAKAGAVLGVGCGGDLAFTVHADHIYELVAFVFEQLRRVDFDKLQFMSEMSFEILYRLYLFELWKGEKLVDMYDAGFESLMDWWENLQAALRSEQPQLATVQRLLANIKAKPDILPMLVPESRGQMLAALAHNGLAGFERDREDAMLLLLNTAQSMRDYRETLEHLNVDATKITVAEGKMRLEALFAPGRSYDWNRLSARLDTLEHQLPERAPFAVAVSQPDMRLGLA